MNKKIPSLSITLATGLLLVGSVNATQLVYTPINPNFGGNPLNGTFLLNQAQAQNDHDDPSLDRSTAGTSPLERFTSQVQSRLLSQLLNDVQNGQTGSLQTDDFLVNIIDDSGALTIQVTDKASGEISEIVVDGLGAN